MNDFEFAKIAFEHNYQLEFKLKNDPLYFITCKEPCNVCTIRKQCVDSEVKKQRITKEEFKILKSEYPEYFI